jgi:aminoglycoside phosphotransferase (APT) family kinase protein
VGYLVSWQEGPTAVPGLGTGEQLADYYARLSGRDVSDVPYWVAFARWRSACISAGVRARYLAGHMADDGYRAEADARAEQAARLAEAARESLLAR